MNKIEADKRIASGAGAFAIGLAGAFAIGLACGYVPDFRIGLLLTIALALVWASFVRLMFSRRQE